MYCIYIFAPQPVGCHTLVGSSPLLVWLVDDWWDRFGPIQKRSDKNNSVEVWEQGVHMHPQKRNIFYFWLQGRQFSFLFSTDATFFCTMWNLFPQKKLNFSLFFGFCWGDHHLLGCLDLAAITCSKSMYIFFCFAGEPKKVRIKKFWRSGHNDGKIMIEFPHVLYFFAPQPVGCPTLVGSPPPPGVVGR